MHDRFYCYCKHVIGSFLAKAFVAIALAVLGLAWSVMASGWGLRLSSEAAQVNLAQHTSVHLMQENDATLSVRVPEASVQVGSLFTLTIGVAGVQTPLSAFQFDLHYDPILLDFRFAEQGGFLTRTGREVVCPQPSLENSTLRLACASTGAADGPTGDGRLAVLTFQAQEAGTASLSLSHVQLLDQSRPPNLLPATLQDGVVNLVSCVLSADFTGSGEVNIMDVMQVASRFGARSGEPLYQARFDLSGNGEIDVADIMAAAAQWRAVC